MTETSLNSKRKTKKRIATYLPSKVTSTSNPEFDRESYYQPGGIMSVLSGPLIEGEKVSSDTTRNLQTTRKTYE